MVESPFVIGIAGGTGAGKTAVANELAAAVGGVAVLPLDNYYEDLSHLPREERADRNYDHPDAFEWDLLVGHLDALLAGESVRVPQYDFERHARREERRPVEPADVIVVEGILALYEPRIRERIDLSVYVQTDADVRILRRVERDVVERGRDLQGVVDQYLATVKPMHEQFVEPTKRHADVIIPDGVNREAVGLLVDRVRAETDLGTLDFDLSSHRGPSVRPPVGRQSDVDHGDD